VGLHVLFQDSDIAIAAFNAQQPGGAKPVAEVVAYEPSPLLDSDKFLTAFDHSSNATYIIISPSNGSQPWLAIWPGSGSAVHVVPNLDKQLAQLSTLNIIQGFGLIATNDTHVLRINPDNGSFESVMPLSDHELQNGAHATTDGEHLYVHLHDSDQYYIATYNFSTSPASMSLSLPNSINNNQFYAMHWSHKYNCIVAMRSSSSIAAGMEVGNQSSVDAAQFQKVVEILGLPHYSDCGRPKDNAHTFVTGDYWYAALDCTGDEGGRQSYGLTYIEMTSKNPKVIFEQIFGPMYEHTHRNCFLLVPPRQN
jgi:hypothetical protein